MRIGHRCHGCRSVARQGRHYGRTMNNEHGDAATIDRRGDGPTQVLIIGVAHLTEAVPDTAIARGRSLLRNWAPDLIAVESLPGHLVVEYEQRGGAFADFPVGGASDARRAAAVAERERPWNLWQSRRVATDESAATDDRVLGWMLAREPLNALLLPWRDADLTGAVRTVLEQLAASPSERVRIGVALAQDLGHRQLVHFDDHSSVGLIDAYPSGWQDVEAAEYGNHARRLIKELPETPGADSDQWRRWVWAASDEGRSALERIESADRVGFPDDTGIVRARLAQWRARNLAMAARLREATGTIPGGRLLAIVGHSHERPLRSALAVDQHDLALTDIATVPGA